MWPNTQINKNIGPIIPAHGDDRLGLGYGQLDQRFRGPWKLGATFPFRAPDQLEQEVAEDEEEDPNPESQQAVISKVPLFRKFDPWAYKKANRLYYAGASTQLAACFERPEDVLAEIIGVGRGLAPIPRLYTPSPDGPAIGGFSSSKAFDERPFKRTGTTQGWAGSPPQSAAQAEDEYEDGDDDGEFYDLLDLARLQRPPLGECFLFRDDTY